jgi:hypothetical protein
MKIGSLVKFHNSLSIKRKSGIILEITTEDLPGQRFGRKQESSIVYTVYWNSNLISSHSAWELFSLEEHENR